MSKIYVLCGMISSGKSTYCNNAAKKGYITVNDDSIVTSVHGGDYLLYDKKLKVLYKSIENNIISLALSLNRPVIVDRGLNINTNGRKRWIALANSFDVVCEAIVFKNDGPEVHAKRRANHDARGHDYNYWYKVANFHNQDYSEPSLDEGFSNIHFLSFEEIKSGKVI